MSRRVVITGLGVISSIGIGWKEFWDNLLKGKSGISPITSFDTSNQFTHNGGEVKNFRPEEFIDKDQIDSLSRASQMALAAAKLAVRDAKLSAQDIFKVTIGTCIGTNIGSIQSVEKVDELIVNKKEITSKQTSFVKSLQILPPLSLLRNLIFRA